MYLQPLFASVGNWEFDDFSESSGLTSEWSVGPVRRVSFATLPAGSWSPVSSRAVEPPLRIRRSK